MHKTSTKQKILLVIFGLFLCGVLLEIGLRVGGFVFLARQQYSNRLSLEQKRDYRILCLGESTTAFGGEDSYPRQLEKILNQRSKGVKFSVINRGLPGATTTDILESLEDNLEKYNPDIVIAMLGINDEGDNDTYVTANKGAYYIKSFLNNLKTFKLVNLLRDRFVNKIKDSESIFVVEGKDTILPKTYDLAHRTKFDKRERELLKKIEREPKSSEAYIILGEHYFEHGEGGKAEKILKEAIAVNPGNSQAYSMLGFFYYHSTAGFAKAEKMFKMAEALGQKDDELLFEMADYYFQTEQFIKAEEVLTKATEAGSKDITLQRMLAVLYKLQGKNALAEEYFSNLSNLQRDYYTHETRYNYLRLKDVLAKEGITLVCMQYPMRSIEPLKKLFKNSEGILFVDNEKVFTEALARSSYNQYFTDMFGGDFGHCTPEGNRLIAENLTNVLLNVIISGER